jgi:hypothetical protein
MPGKGSICLKKKDCSERERWRKKRLGTRYAGSLIRAPNFPRLESQSLIVVLLI